MAYEYKNPWYNSSYEGSQPTFTTETAPFEYKGVQVFKYPNRFDYVHNGVAFAQRATKTNEGAKAFIDYVLSGEDLYLNPDFSKKTEAL